LKKLGVLAIQVAIITLFVTSLWWAADKNEAFSQDQMWLVDCVLITAKMSLNDSAAHTSNKLASQLKKFLARIYLASEEWQRRRAAALIHRYRHPIPMRRELK
jgi:hypothetical protein